MILGLELANTNAQIYADYRPRYPQTLIDGLRHRTVGDHGELFIDWGCGTGELTLRLSPYFDRVIAVDTGADRIALGQEKARREGLGNVEWHVDKAENVEAGVESCDLITSASAFHWMDRELLSARAFSWLKPGGAFALVGGAGTDVWSGAAEWQRVAVECMKKYLRQPSAEPPEPKKKPVARGSASKDEAEPPKKKWHADFLTAAGFQVGSFQYPTEFSWPIDEVAGYMYSITGGLPWKLGDRRAAFERDFRDALARINPSGFVDETIDFFLLIGRKA